MRAAELRDRVVAVLVEHARVQLVGALVPDSAGRAVCVAAATWPRNSSRNRRRSDFADRE